MKCLYRDKKGLSLIEVLLVIFLLSIAALIITSMTTTNYKNLGRSRDTGRASNACQQIIEEWKLVDPSTFTNYNNYNSRVPGSLPSLAEAKQNCLAWTQLAKEVDQDANLRLFVNTNNQSPSITLYTLTVEIRWKTQIRELITIVPVRR